LAARLGGVARVVNALTGLGHIFTSRSLKARLVWALIYPIIKAGLARRGSILLLQNRDDLTLLKELGLENGNSVIIRGSGVDVRHFRPTGTLKRPMVTAAFVGRIIEIKGVRVLVEAHRRLRNRGVSLRLLLVGEPDRENPGAISAREISKWAEEPDIEWRGYSRDIRSIWAEAQIAVLPSLGGEGLPKALLEAAACGRALIATDVAGSREIAISGRNALVVPPGDPQALCDALERLSLDDDLREEFGQESRRLVETDMAEEAITAQVVDLYTNMMR
jgi:glycosyltransferase involved in cell wall biosynthesis